MKNKLLFNSTNVDYPKSVNKAANEKTTISIYGSAYDFLSELKEQKGWLNSVKVELTKDNAVIEGDIHLSDVEFNLSACTAICKITESKTIN